MLTLVSYTTPARRATHVSSSQVRGYRFAAFACHVAPLPHLRHSGVGTGWQSCSLIDPATDELKASGQYYAGK